MAKRTGIINVVGSMAGAHDLGLASDSYTERTLCELDFATYQGGYGRAGTYCCAFLDVRVMRFAHSSFDDDSVVFRCTLGIGESEISFETGPTLIYPDDDPGGVTIDIDGKKLVVKTEVPPAQVSYSDDYVLAVAQITGQVLEWEHPPSE